MNTTMIFADSHTYPGDNMQRFYAAGCMARKLKVHSIVDLGDRGRWDSLSFHNQPGTLTDKKKVAFTKDKASVQKSQQKFLEGLDGYDPYKDIILGNHENRMDRYVEANPALEGILESCHVISSMPEFEGWKVHPYRSLLSICGGAVLATHIPCNGLNRPYGGVNACRTIAMHSSKTIVFGHRHTFEISTAGRVDNKPVQAVSAPCFMPEGRIEDYAVGGLCNWVYGLLLVRWGDRQRPAFQHIPMKDVLSYAD